MERERFIKLAEEALDALPARFRKRIHNLAILVEDLPPAQLSRRGPRNAEVAGRPAQALVLGVFEGVPATQRSVFALPAGPDHIVLFQKNIEAVCRDEAEIREEVRQTLLHELGHYFGMNETQLKDV